ncbi:MAG: TetR/AcrR family transcriptional regulator [Candidatus Geothermincolia bacterium]
MRKSPDERRAELIAAARKLLEEKGVGDTSVSDIVREVGVAQGTFYWYFESKEDVLNAVLEQIADEICDSLEDIAARPRLSALAKIKKMRASVPLACFEREPLAAYFHGPAGRQFHDQLNRQMIVRLIPIYTGVIQQGIDEGAFHTAYPEEVAAFMLVSAQALEIFVDEGHTDLKRHVKALMDFCLFGLRYGEETAGPE